jgi:hypothetical protein
VSDQNPIRSAAREALRKERFGANDFCFFCGYACLESLTQVSRNWLEARGLPTEVIEKLFEDHHVHGEAHDPNLTVTLCLNCHRAITEGLTRGGATMSPENNIVKSTAIRLRASAAFFDLLAISYRNCAKQLESEYEKNES